MINKLKLKNNPLETTSIIIIAVLLFWVTGITPSFIAKTSAEKYVETKYKDRNLTFLRVR